MSMEETSNVSPENELRKEKNIQLSYNALSLDLYYELINIIEALSSDFPESDLAVSQENADLAERVSADEDNEEKNMGDVTLKLKFKATDEEFEKIKEAINENLSPSIYEEQNKIVDDLLSK